MALALQAALVNGLAGVGWLELPRPAVELPGGRDRRLCLRNRHGRGQGLSDLHLGPGLDRQPGAAVPGPPLGTVGVLAWVTGAHARWQWGLSPTGPSRPLIDILLLGGTAVPLWGTLMIAGVPLPLGSWVSVRIAGPVAWRAPAVSAEGCSWVSGHAARGMRHPARAGMARLEPGIGQPFRRLTQLRGAPRALLRLEAR